MRTRLFLRTAEFLWQEGHTAHSSGEEAIEETHKMLKVYEDFMKNHLAIPVIPGKKTPEEKFPGAVDTFTVEAIMQDNKALQMGTSHYMGQNFAISSGIKFQNKEGKEEHAYTTSWGVSTRMIGGLIMTHSDDNGLILPPKIASKQFVIIPFTRKGNDDKILDYCYSLKKDLENNNYGDSKIGVIIDNSDLGGGQKYWNNVRKGVPIILKIGEKEIENDSLTLIKRNNIDENISLTKEKLILDSTIILDEIQEEMYQKALNYKNENIVEIDSINEFKKQFSKNNPKFIICYSDPEINEERENLLKDYKSSPRCIPNEYNIDNDEGTCIFTGKKTKTKILYAKAY